jgi:hypothetical protein
MSDLFSTFKTRVQLSPRFIKMRNQIFTTKERDLLRLALVNQLLKDTLDGVTGERIEDWERLIQKFNDGKTFK